MCYICRSVPGYWWHRFDCSLLWCRLLIKSFPTCKLTWGNILFFWLLFVCLLGLNRSSSPSPLRNKTKVTNDTWSINFHSRSLHGVYEIPRIFYWPLEQFTSKPNSVRPHPRLLDVRVVRKSPFDMTNRLLVWSFSFLNLTSFWKKKTVKESEVRPRPSWSPSFFHKLSVIDKFV